MFGIQKCGTFLTVGINLVVCGAIVFYFHKRLLSLESALLKQQQIFSAFVVEIRNKTQLAQTMLNPNQNGMLSSTTTTELASPEAIAAVSKMATMPQMNKIEVSDNELSSSDDEDDSDDESVSDEEEEEEKEENIKKIKLSDFQETNLATKFEEMMVSSMSNNFMMMQGSGGGVEMLSGGIMIINGQPRMQNEQMMMPCFVEITDLNEEEEETTKKVILLNDDEDSDSEFESDEEEETSRKSPVLLQIESLHEGDADEPIKIIKNTDFNELMKKQTTPLPKKTPKKNIVVMDMGLMTTSDKNAGTSASEAVTSANEVVTSEAVTSTSEAVTSTSEAAEAANKSENLKVDDLRKLASEKNLAAKEIIKKMKKPELLALLKQ